ncbi:MAG: TRAP transporter small permease subunit [Candidatus Rokubacteria bacterium]|nr:TRAP transporter small permease subunit [Candidatus Rokubacteria bacterium]
MERVLRVIDSLNDWCGRLVGFQILFVAVVILYEVVLRAGFNAPTLWANETMIYVTAVAYLLGGGYALLHRRHVSVDVVYARFSPRTRARLDVATLAFLVLYLAALGWAGGRFAWDSIGVGETTGTPWNPPIWPVKLAIPIAAALVLLQGIANVVRDVTAARRDPGA